MGEIRSSKNIHVMLGKYDANTHGWTVQKLGNLEGNI